MQDSIEKTIIGHYGVSLQKIEPLGGGFYGRVFHVSLPVSPFSVVCKVYLFPGLARKEAEQITVLTAHSLLKMPALYHLSEKEQTGFSYDLLLMEYLPGVNAGFLDVSALPPGAKEKIGQQIVDNLIALHNTTRSEGFGEISGGKTFAQWQDCYYPTAKETVGKAKKLFDKGQLSAAALSVFETSLRKFDDLFDQPIPRARLIHGDYNTWNILLNEEKTEAAAVIDPFGCRWADSELDLYQLDNANGKEYGLLDRYAKKVPLSKNFEKKRRFYEYYTEIAHYHDAQVPVHQESAEKLAEKLKEVL